MAVGLPRHERHLQGIVDALADVDYPGLSVEAAERTRPPPVLIAHLVPGGWRDGSAARTYDDAGIVVQVTCTAHTWQVAAHLWDLVEERLLHGHVAVDDRRVDVDTHGGGRQVRADRTVHPTVWSAHPHYVLVTTPA